MRKDISSLVIIKRFIEILEDDVYSCADLLVTIDEVKVVVDILQCLE